LQGVAAGLASGSAERICSEFASTPPTVNENVYTPYSYAVTEIKVTRSVRGRVLAVDTTGGDIQTYPLALEESKIVNVAYGRKEGDRGSSKGTITDADLERVASSDFELDAERLVLSLEPSRRVSRPRTDLLTTLSEKPQRKMPAPSVVAMANTGSSAEPATRQVAFAQRPPVSDVTALDDRMQSVVVVLNPKGSIGAGFYVDTNDILTNYHVVEGASTVELRGLDGQLFTGRVVRKDIGVDLALLRVERTGIPVQFSQSIIKAGDTVDAIGHPKGLYFSVSRAIVSAVRQMKGVLAQGGDKALVVQTDAQINPGNSGGPLFFKDRVIGVNTLKFRGADGIGFAVHYSEALRFLSQQ
jgi:S1-C subfamily serine protease